MQGLLTLLITMPFMTALFTAVASGRLSQHVARISVAGTAVTFFLAAVVLWQALAGHAVLSVTFTQTWGILAIDPLGALLASVISGISLIVHVYSVRYMAEEEGYGRFFVLLDLMTATLLLMVCAGDLVTLLIAWHLVGVLLYFLLGQDMRSRSAHHYAFRTFLTYRIGDLPLVLAAVLLFDAYDTWSLSEIFSRITADPLGHEYLGLPLPILVAALIALAAFARSAQFLLHTWLPYTMSGPTPVSALMHAGIVNAGGFLINRFAPVFVHAGDVLHWLFVVGLVTALVGSVLMLAQSDIKKALGYSTMGQMGFMIMECGVGAFSLAVYHLIAHGLFKGTLFLGAGGVIKESRRDDRVPKDDLYTFVVERRPPRQRQPWLLMALITLAVPMTILVVAHWLVSQDFFQQQGAIVLLFFGWVTGAQLIFATYRMRTQNVWRLFTLIVFSFAVVIVGYTLISHAFDVFLYPDPVFRTQLYAAADVDIFWFDVLVVLMTLVVVSGWLLTYYAEQQGRRHARLLAGLWSNVYAVISREFYITALYTRLSASLMGAISRVNVLLRWV
ncbi:MAG TPA: proton-conducting transporter membrane subunit [Gammaproteobacteria bacterium]|nr:proton-conducting transporter membrane subunit [Gammaproteobacteria bacterium]